jgi:hypothetical protein
VPLVPVALFVFVNDAADRREGFVVVASFGADLDWRTIGWQIRNLPDFLSLIEGGIPEGRVVRLPEADDISIPVQTQLIIELCSQ